MEILIIMLIISQIAAVIVIYRILTGFKEDLIWFSGVLVDQKTEICRLDIVLMKYKKELDEYHKRE